MFSFRADHGAAAKLATAYRNRNRKVLDEWVFSSQRTVEASTKKDLSLYLPLSERSDNH